MSKCNDPEPKNKISEPKADMAIRCAVAIPLMIVFMVAYLIVNWLAGGSPVYTITGYVVFFSYGALFFWAVRPGIAVPRKSTISVPSLALWLLILFSILFANAAGTAILAGNDVNWGVDQYKQNFEALDAVTMFLVCIFGPIGEELLYRGALFGWLSKRMPIIASALISSAAFALSHMTAFHLVTAMTLGVFLCAFYARFGRLWMCCVVHCAYDLCVAFLSGWLGIIVVGGVCVCGIIVLVSWLIKSSDTMGVSYIPSKLKVVADGLREKTQTRKALESDTGGTANDESETSIAAGQSYATHAAERSS